MKELPEKFRCKNISIDSEEEAKQVSQVLLRYGFKWWNDRRPKGVSQTSEWNAIHISAGEEDFFIHHACGLFITAEEFLNHFNINHNLKTMEDKTSITTFHKNSKLSANQKVLLEAGLIDQCGEVTDMGKDLLVDLLFEQNEEALVEVAKKYNKK